LKLLLILLLPGCSDWTLFGRKDLGGGPNSPDDTAETTTPDTGHDPDTGDEPDPDTGERPCSAGELTLANADPVRLREDAAEDDWEARYFGQLVQPGRDDGVPAIWVNAARESEPAVYLLTATELSTTVGEHEEPVIYAGRWDGDLWLVRGGLTTREGAWESSVWVMDDDGTDDGEAVWYLFHEPPEARTTTDDADVTIETYGYGGSNLSDLVVGDLDGDGLDDAVNFHGSGYNVFTAPFSSYYDARVDADVELAIDAESYGALGGICVTADLDEDGYADMACGGGINIEESETWESSYMGVYLGPMLERDSLGMPDIVYWTDEGVPPNLLGYSESNSGFSGLVPLGDVTGDGHPDLAVTSRDERYGDVDSSATFVLDSFEPGTWPIEEVETVLVAPGHSYMPAGNAAQDLVRSAGDLNGDGMNDVLVSEKLDLTDPYQDTDHGSLYLVMGPVTGVVMLEDLETRVVVPDMDDSLYSARWSSATDLDDDGRSEFTVTLFQWNEPSTMYLFRGCEDW